MKVLVVEDSPDVVEAVDLVVTMRWPGATVLSTEYGCEAPQLLESEAPDIVLLDLGLPDTDGLQVLQEMRFFSDVPIIIVTAKEDMVTQVKGLEMGADDFIVKPFAHTELMARVNALLRRTSMPELWNKQEGVNVPDLAIDLGARRLLVKGQEVDLTPIEWNTLTYLVRNEKRVISHQVLAEKVWGAEYIKDSAIKMCVRRLRLKLDDNLRAPRIIRSHRGLGYSFTTPAGHGRVPELV